MKNYKRLDGKPDPWEIPVRVGSWVLIMSIAGYFWAHIIIWVIK